MSVELWKVQVFNYLFDCDNSQLWHSGSSIFIKACRIFSCGMWNLSCRMCDLVPRSGIKPGSSSLAAWSLSHETTREVPQYPNDKFDLPSVIFPGGTSGKEPTCQCRRCKRCGFKPCFRKIPWRRTWQPTPIFLPGEFHGQRSLVGYSPWGHKESEMTQQLTLCLGGSRLWCNLVTHPG